MVGWGRASGVAGAGREVVRGWGWVREASLDGGDDSATCKLEPRLYVTLLNVVRRRRRMFSFRFAVAAL